jgi:hypothetical protein
VVKDMRMFVMRSLHGAMVAALLGAGCATSNPAGPGPATPTLTGTWAGDVTESYGGRGRLRLTIEQTQFALSGTFQLEFEDAARNRSGRLTGNTEQPSLAPRMQLAASGGFDCGPGLPSESFMQVTWTRTGDTLKGDYAGFGCVGPVTGTFDVRKD